nr:uncharacterized protein LOC117219348 isoform X2 [Megalopta genalis]
MFDCFNMAYQDKRNALQLNIKVNSENLLPHPQKCNAGSLRIPADPSWPKIPQRKIVDDFSDTVEPPCIITLTGSPRRSRTIVQTPLNQSPKSAVTKDSAYSSFNYQRNTSSSHTLKRLPGYVDPRFKKVKTIKRNHDLPETRINQGDMETLDNEKMTKIAPERNINQYQMQVLEKQELYDTSKIKDPNAKLLSSGQYKNSKASRNINSNEESMLKQRKNVNNILQKSDKTEFVDKIEFMKSISCNEHQSRTSMNDANVQVDVTSLQVQENNGQLLFVMDPKVQPHPLNAIQLDTITVPQECLKQFYNVQVPILTYKNIPIPIPAAEASSAMQQCPSNSKQKNETLIAFPLKEEVEHGVHASDNKSINQIQQTSLDEAKDTHKPLVLEAEKVISGEKHTSDSKAKDALKVQNTVASENRKNITHLSKKLESSKVPKKLQESSDSEYYIPNIIKGKFHNSMLQHASIKKYMCNTSGGETTDSEFIFLKNVKKKEPNDANKLATKHHKINSCDYEKSNVTSKEKNDCIQSNKGISVQDQSHQEHKKCNHETKARNKSEQNLTSSRNECTRKLYRSSEPHITFKQKIAPRKLSRKARFYFQKNSHSALVDSDYTSAWPNCQSNKYRCSQTNIQKHNSHRIKKIDHHSNAKLSIQENRAIAQVESNLNPVEQSFFQSDQNIKPCRKCEISPRSNTNDTVESPKGIPPKTQELLNKSYWEYYNKLKHKIKNTDSIESQYLHKLTMDVPEVTNEKSNEVYDKNFQKQLNLNPEFQTLQQCSALSSVINKALDAKLQPNIVKTSQLYLNGNIKSPTDPLVDTQTTSKNNVIPDWINNGETVFQKVKYQKASENDRQYLELKSIIFFGGMMYILIIFLPMLYDYFNYEVYDDYENLSYLEFIMDYILSSFKEAFGGIFSGIKQIFFFPPACKKCNNIV